MQRAHQNERSKRDEELTVNVTAGQLFSQARQQQPQRKGYHYLLRHQSVANHSQYRKQTSPPSVLTGEDDTKKEIGSSNKQENRNSI
jgi:hypothetical protein